MNDILTVMWKERKGLFRYKGSRTRFLLVLLTPVLLAVVMPWQWGAEWVEEIPTVILAALIPMILVGVTIPDSFAGERERHTLETLLASRLPDRAILFGKLAMAVGLAWGMTLLALLIALVTVHVTHWDGRIMFYTPTIVLANVVVSFLLASLMACLGILISLRAATVQGAQQTLMFATLMPLTLLGVIMTAVVGMNHQWLTNIKDFFGAIELWEIVLILGAILLVGCLGLLRAAMARFQRARLILN